MSAAQPVKISPVADIVADMKADPTITPDMAETRILQAEKGKTATRLDAIKGVEGETGKIKAAPAAGGTAEGTAPEVPANELAAKAKEYIATQAKIGIAVTADAAVAHVRKQLAPTA